MKKNLIAAAVGAALTSLLASVAHAGVLDGATQVWEYRHASTNSFLSEILAFDSSRNELWVSGVSGVDILNANTGALQQRIDVSSFGSVNSVSIKNGVAALAIENSTRTNPGLVQTYSTASRSLTGSYTVGALPDMLTFTPDGSKILVANEGTPNAYGSAIPSAGTYLNFAPSASDPAGSVSIINLAAGTVTTTTNLASAPREGSNIRTNTGMDFEPEYIAVNAAGTKAYVSLQEANAMGVLDIATGSFEKVVGLGAKGFNTATSTVDVRNGDGVNFVNTNNLKGLYQPDGVATYQHNGQTLVVMANEGDFREDSGDEIEDGSSVGAVAPLDKVSISGTDTTSATDMYMPGARSFSIRDENGNLLYDSGDILDKQAHALGIYDDGRSDNKGVEPEGVEIMEINGRTIAFVGLERTTKAAVAAFDITDPTQVSFIKILTSNAARAPEGLEGYRIGNEYYLSMSSEGSNAATANYTTTFHLATAVPEPGTYALVLSGLMVLGALRRRQA